MKARFSMKEYPSFVSNMDEPEPIDIPKLPHPDWIEFQYSLVHISTNGIYIAVGEEKIVLAGYRFGDKLKGGSPVGKN